MVVLLVHARVAGWARDGERQGRHGTLELDGARGPKQLHLGGLAKKLKIRGGPASQPEPADNEQVTLATVAMHNCCHLCEHN